MMKRATVLAIIAALTMVVFWIQPGWAQRVNPEVTGTVALQPACPVADRSYCCKLRLASCTQACKAGKPVCDWTCNACKRTCGIDYRRCLKGEIVTPPASTGQ